MSISPILGECARLAIAYAENVAVVRAKQTSRRFGYVAALTISAATIGIASVACALTALWVALLPYCGPAGAPLIVSAVLFFGCLSALGLLRYGRRPGDATPISSAGSNPPTGEQTIPLLIGAVLAGLAMGSSRK